MSRMVLILTALLACPALLRATDPVVVTLRPSATVASRVVTVADVAEVTGGPEQLRERVGRLDLSEISTGVTLSRMQVAIRLRLADLPATLCHVRGAESVKVTTRFRTVTADEVVTAARKALLATLPYPAGEVQVDLVQPVVVPLPQVAADESVSIRAEPKANHRPPGRMQMDVSIDVGGEQRLALAVYFEVRPCVRVLVCRGRIDKGEVLSEAKVYEDLRPVDGRSSLALTPGSMAGKRAKMTLMPGQVVQTSDVGSGEDDGPTIKSQDAVRLRVRIGALKVMAAGQALQDGAAGQLIRVQNIDSKKVLLGRVVERGLVEIE